MINSGGFKNIFGALTVLTLLLAGPYAFGRTGVSGAARGLKDPKSLDGLCTVGNKSQPWVTGKYCAAIRKTFLQDCKSKFTNVKNNLETSGLGAEFRQICPGFDNLKNDELKFSMMLENLSAALFIEESDWRANARGDGGKSQGISQISLKVAKNRAYSCGCKGITKQADVDNGALNAGCGASIVIHWLDQQVYQKRPANGHVIGGGPAGQPGKSKGLANYFGPFGDGQKKTKGKRMREKLTTWCKANGDGKPDAQGIDLIPPSKAIQEP